MKKWEQKYWPSSVAEDNAHLVDEINQGLPDGWKVIKVWHKGGDAASAMLQNPVGEERRINLHPGDWMQDDGSWIPGVMEHCK